MIVGRMQSDQLQIIDRLREPVRLAEGLTENQQLRPDVAQRALDCLERFGQRIRELEPGKIRAVGTNTLRMAHSASGFLDHAQQALRHRIEIISGIEEARLVYLGVAHSLPDPEGLRLAVDIGGGSTEVIIGEGFSPLRMESLYMGCVNMSQRFFPDGEITKSAMKLAILAARLEIHASKRSFRKLGWALAAGSSGTIRTVLKVVQASGWSDNGITPESLKKLRNCLVEAGHADKINFDAVNEDRKPVFAGGVAILSGVFQALGIERMQYSSGALREGLLYDLLGRIQHRDIRESTVQALAQRYHVDTRQAERIDDSAQALLEQIKQNWKLNGEDSSQWLHWASLLHEIGLVIAHSQYHKHGAYLIEHSDLPGFSLLDQRFLGLLIRCHRRKFRKDAIELLPENLHQTAVRLCVLLRIGVLLHRSHSSRDIPEPVMKVDKQTIKLQFPAGWLDENPLTQADLALEKKNLKAVGLVFKYS